MDVVGSAVGVKDLNGLPSHDAEDMWDVTAAALVDRDGRLGNGKAAVAKTVFHVNEYVCKIATIDNEVFRGGELGAAIGIIGHVDSGRDGAGAFEVNCAGDSGFGVGIDGGNGLGLWSVDADTGVLTAYEN
jgi:hypothetical protein